MHSIAGGSNLDAALIAQILARGALCLDCIVRKTGIPHDAAKLVLDRVQRVLIVSEAEARCEGCLQTASVFRLGG